MRRSWAFLAVAALPVGLLGAAAPAGAATTPAGCAGWTVTTVASGLGTLENIAPDGAGGLYVSAVDRSAVERVTATGRTTVATGLDAPGGLVRAGGTLYVNTGDSALNIALALPGTVTAIDLATGATRKVASVTAPNGLAGLPDGSLAAASSAVFGLSGITRVVPSTGVKTARWSSYGHSNGLAVSPDGTTLYSDDTYTGEIVAIPLLSGGARAGAARTVARIGTVLDAVDDLTATPDGSLYVAANLGNRVEKVDPATGAHCAIATVPGASSVRVGPGVVGPGGPAPALFTSGWDGTVRELDPPAGVTVG
ncbi:SMP-30/gluconolactonase/LRE family protein [Spongisporangium articulatum]|uniref:SMP-30/gluconolactonase/LRE family protein n=1 Tax=Spongisporangium articulatum TaxID=3362603 RepID=A0ABW8ARM7_9ACTN